MDLNIIKFLAQNDVHTYALCEIALPSIRPHLVSNSLKLCTLKKFCRQFNNNKICL